MHKTESAQMGSRASALLAEAMASVHAGRYRAALRQAEEAVGRAREEHDAQVLARAMCWKSTVHRFLDQVDRHRALFFGTISFLSFSLCSPMRLWRAVKRPSP